MFCQIFVFFFKCVLVFYALNTYRVDVRQKKGGARENAICDLFIVYRMTHLELIEVFLYINIINIKYSFNEK